MTQSTKKKSLCNFFVLLLVRSLNFLIFREILKMSFLEYWKRFFKDSYRALNGDMGEKTILGNESWFFLDDRYLCNYSIHCTKVPF